LDIRKLLQDKYDVNITIKALMGHLQQWGFRKKPSKKGVEEIKSVIAEDGGVETREIDAEDDGAVKDKVVNPGRRDLEVSARTPAAAETLSAPEYSLQDNEQIPGVKELQDVPKEQASLIIEILSDDGEVTQGPKKRSPGAPELGNDGSLNAPSIRPPVNLFKAKKVREDFQTLESDFCILQGAFDSSIPANVAEYTTIGLSSGSPFCELDKRAWELVKAIQKRDAADKGRPVQLANITKEETEYGALSNTFEQLRKKKLESLRIRFEGSTYFQYPTAGRFQLIGNQTWQRVSSGMTKSCRKGSAENQSSEKKLAGKRKAEGEVVGKEKKVVKQGPRDVKASAGASAAGTLSTQEYSLQDNEKKLGVTMPELLEEVKQLRQQQQDLKANIALMEFKLARLEDLCGEFGRESPQLQQTQKFIAVERETSSNIASKTPTGDEGFKPGPKESSPRKKKARGKSEAAGKEKKVVKTTRKWQNSRMCTPGVLSLTRADTQSCSGTSRHSRLE
jgi:hypothetical protein